MKFQKTATLQHCEGCTKMPCNGPQKGVAVESKNNTSLHAPRLFDGGTPFRVKGKFLQGWHGKKWAKNENMT